MPVTLDTAELNTSQDLFFTLCSSSALGDSYLNTFGLLVTSQGRDGSRGEAVKQYRPLGAQPPPETDR